MESPKPLTKTRIKRVGKFGAVGVFNTALDFVIYNILSSRAGLSLVQSNIISTTIAMLVSFFANKKLVFKKHDGSVIKQGIVFFAVTAFGLYVLQNGTITLLTEIWHWPLGILLMLAHAVGIQGHDSFLIKNGAKAIATLVSLSWNYIMYKKVVFR